MKKKKNHRVLQLMKYNIILFAQFFPTRLFEIISKQNTYNVFIIILLFINYFN